MTADRENLYWRTNKAWYTINAEGEYELTESATERAKRSFALFNSPTPSQRENKRTLKP